MSAYDIKMETNEVDDAESAYFQEVNLLEDNTDQSSGSFQGSLTIPSFSMNSSGDGVDVGCQGMGQSRGKVELSSVALQGSQGFQTLDQSALGGQWQTPGSDNEAVNIRLLQDATVAVDVFSCGFTADKQKTALVSIDMQEMKNNENFLFVNTIPSDFLISEQYAVMKSETNNLDSNNSSMAHGATCNVNEPVTVYSQMESGGSTTESSNQETRSPKRRQKKSRSHQGSDQQVSSLKQN